MLLALGIVIGLIVGGAVLMYVLTRFFNVGDFL